MEHTNGFNEYKQLILDFMRRTEEAQKDSRERGEKILHEINQRLTTMETATAFERGRAHRDAGIIGAATSGIITGLAEWVRYHFGVR